MIVDLPAAQFCQSKDIGEFIGTDLPASHAKLFMFKFHDCWVDMDKLFPIGAGLKTCKALFRTYADHKYAEYYSPPFAGQLRAHAASDYDNAFVLGGVDNYWHFLVDHLAKTPLLRHFNGGLPTVVVNDRLTNGFVQLVERACSFLNLAQPALVTESRPILKLKNSFVPCVNDAAPRLRFLRELGASIQAADRSAAPERIFFRRGAVSQRRVLNESEVEQHTQAFLKAACGHLGVGHHFLQGNPVGNQPASGSYARWDNQDYTVPVDQLLKLVDAIAGHRA